MPPSSSSSFLETSKGRIGVIPLSNPKAMNEANVSLQPKMALIGDLNTIDLAQTKRTILSGRLASAKNEVFVREHWPNEFLDPLLGKEKDFVQLNPQEFAAGVITKMYVELDQSLAGSRIDNQLHAFMEIFKLALSSQFSDVQTLTTGLFTLLERRSLDWDHWEPIAAWLVRAKDTLRNRSMEVLRDLQNRQFKRTADSLPHGLPPAKVQNNGKGPIFGIPADWLKERLFCIRFQMGSCTHSGNHSNPDTKTGGTVKHQCGGCFKIGKGDDSSHGMKTCPNKTNGLFH